MDIWSYVWSNGALWVLAGIALYLTDRQQWWLNTYRFVYDFGHTKRPMPKDVVRGFFYNQTTAQKAVRSLALVGLLALTQVFVPGVNLLGQIVVSFVQWPAFCIGLALGWLLSKVLPYRKQIFDTVDKIGEQASRENIDKIAKQASSLGGGLVDGAFDLPRALKNAVLPEYVPPAPQAPASKAEAETPPPDPEPAPDSREALDRFLNRGR